MQENKLYNTYRQNTVGDTSSEDSNRSYRNLLDARVEQIENNISTLKGLLIINLLCVFIGFLGMVLLLR